MKGFHYDAAFERNLGWLTEAEQLTLRGKKVAIAGLGGVGGVHLTTLARFGVGAFHIADFDHFSLANFNRQIGATMQTIGRPKIEVLEEMALAINPELKITRFDQGVTAENLEAFLAGVDVFVDGFDFFVMDIRRRVYARCHELGIPSVCAGPIGMSAGLLAFDPAGMSFEEYFRMEGRSEDEQYLRFLIGLVPKSLQQPYLVDRTRMNVATKSGPSTGAACELCAGVAAITAVKFLLRRGDPKPAPWNHQYDAFRNELATTKLRWGLNGPVLRSKIKLFGPRIIESMYKQSPPPATFFPEDVVDEILHAARWAPSGDNEQPWRFEKLNNEAILVHLAGHDTQNVYHYRADEPNILAAGMLLENLRIAASVYGKRTTWRVHSGPTPLTLHVQFIADATVLSSPLYASVGQRSVDRNRYSVRKLTNVERSTLEAALDNQLKIDWHSTAASRLGFAHLSALATGIRLRTQEAFPVHQSVIDWDNTLSPDKIPARALGLRRLTLLVMRWAMRDWRRVKLLNKLGGIQTVRLETDYIPIFFSSAAFSLRFATARHDRGTEDLLRAGECIQRLWLTATRLGLALQPALAILIFAHYGQKEVPFAANSKVRGKAKDLARQFTHFFAEDPDEFVFMGRIGQPLRRIGVCRSVRKPLAGLMAFSE